MMRIVAVNELCDKLRQLGSQVAHAGLLSPDRRAGIKKFPRHPGHLGVLRSDSA